MTDRSRQLAKITPNATRPARLPPLGKVVTGKADLDGWISRVNEHLEVREGVRGNPFEKAVTGRDLVDMGVVGSTQIVFAKPASDAQPDGVVVSSKDGKTVLGWDDVAARFIGTKLYTDLTKRIDDPSRFDDLHERTKAALLKELAPLDGQIRASIQRTQEQVTSATESFAQEVLTIQASLKGAAAGVREVRFASASANRATAGIVTQVTARLDNFTGGAPGTATVETKMTAIADRATGLEAQYVLKVTAGGATAGFGVAATSTTAGTSSAFIIQADKFAIVDSSYAGGLTNSPPAGSVMFGVDSDGAYIGGNLKVAGKALINGTAVVDTFNVALAVNNGLAAQNGIYARTNTIWSGNGVAIRGVATNSGHGVFGSTIGGGGGAAGFFLGDGAGYGVIAAAQNGATALKIQGGPMVIDNSTLVVNLNAEKLGGNLASSFVLYQNVVDVGNPGTPTHALHCIIGATAFRIPVLIP